MRGEFEQYRAMGKRIELKKQELKGMDRLTDTVRGSSPEWPYTAHTMTICGRNAAEETEILKLITQLESRRAVVRRLIEHVKEENVKLMLELKYTEGGYKSWDEVAAEMQETEDVSGDALRKRADKFFLELSRNSRFSGLDVL